jgi:hypothetical protein
MRTKSIAAGVLIVLMNTSCGGNGGWPTEQDIVNFADDAVRSVAGDWEATATVPNGLRLDFRLVEGANGQLSGTGTMKENSTAPAVPFTVSGTFQRPMLTLAFEGMVFESRQVKGVAQGSYTTVAGIGTNLTLTAPGYTRDIAILMHEK